MSAAYSHCGRCHSILREGRAKGLVIVFCNCLPRDTRIKLMEVLAKVEQLEVAQYAT